MSTPLKLSLLAAALALAGCSALEPDKVDYRATTKAPSLIVPPDLNQLSRETRYTMVDGGVSAASGKAASSAAAGTAAPVLGNALADARIERNGNQRWLVVKRPAAQLWNTVKDFWIENGFLLSMDQRDLGIMETEWAENRAKLPQDVFRATVGKVFESLYSTPERDKYRTRLEANANGETEIFISHRGVAEIYVNERNNETIWQPRPSDPELEAEFLRRLLQRLGSTPEEARKLVAEAPAAQPAARIDTSGAAPALRLGDDFDRAWRRLGLALDRTGFTVEDRDRKRGIYFVRYVGAEPQAAEPGFLSKLFGSSKPEPNTQATKYQIALGSDGQGSSVSVNDADGKPASPATANRIIKVLADDLR